MYSVDNDFDLRDGIVVRVFTHTVGFVNRQNEVAAMQVSQQSKQTVNTGTVLINQSLLAYFIEVCHTRRILYHKTLNLQQAGVFHVEMYIEVCICLKIKCRLMWISHQPKIAFV